MTGGGELTPEQYQALFGEPPQAPNAVAPSAPPPPKVGATQSSIPPPPAPTPQDAYIQAPRKDGRFDIRQQPEAPTASAQNSETHRYGNGPKARRNVIGTGIVVAFLVVAGIGAAIVELTTTDEDRLDALKAELIAADVQVLNAHLNGELLVLEVLVEHPGDGNGLSFFADEASDIVEEVSNSRINYGQLELGLYTNLANEDSSLTRGRVVLARWTKTVVDDTGWFFLNEEEFLTDKTVSLTMDETALDTGLSYQPTTTATVAPTTSSTTPTNDPPAGVSTTSTIETTTTAQPESPWCRESDGRIPIDRSCFVYWPLTVEDVLLHCDGFDVFVVTEDGKRYGVNGRARSQDKFLDIDEITTDLIAERVEVQSMINFAATIPGCGIDGLGVHQVPDESQTTVPTVEQMQRIGAVVGSSSCSDGVNDFHLSELWPDAQIQQPNYLDIDTVVLTVSEETTSVAWRVHGQVPSSIGETGVSRVESGSWSVTIWSDDESVLPEGDSFRGLILAVDITADGLLAAHEGFGSDDFAYINGRGQVERTGAAVTAVFRNEDLGAIPSEFNWTASLSAIVLADATDPNVFTVTDDSACTSMRDGGVQFPGG